LDSFISTIKRNAKNRRDGRGKRSDIQISQELHEYMWLSPYEIESLLTLSAKKYAERYEDHIHKALDSFNQHKPRSGKAQQEFSNPLTGFNHFIISPFNKTKRSISFRKTI
jgi:hypothetical protein